MFSAYGAVELPEVGHELLHPGRHRVVLAFDVRVARERGQLLVLQPKLVRLRVGLERERVVGLDQLGALAFEKRQDLGRRGDLVEAGEPERVVPRLADRAVAVEHRAGGCVLAPQLVSREQAPQPSVLGDPVGDRVEVDRRPFLRLARPDRQAVAAGVVDEGHREHAETSAPGRTLAQGPAPEAAQGRADPPEGLRDGQLDLQDVLAGLEVRGMRPAPGEDHRVVAHPDQPLAVIPAPPQVVATEVVTRVGDPLGLELARPDRSTGRRGPSPSRPRDRRRRRTSSGSR